MTGIDLVKAAVRALDEKKAEDIEVIQITELSVVADYFVIANGTSNSVVVHVFHKESRAYYNLERLWADGKKIEIDDMIDS